MHGALIASLSAVALIIAANESVGASGAAHVAGSAFTHPTSHPSVARSLHHHRRNNVGALWLPDAGDLSYGPGNGEPSMDVTPPASGDIHHSYTYDVPWDAVHRFPPAVTPSARAYVPECTAQTVTVPRHEGKEQTADINIMRCY
jgi:hypothetical protein